MPCFSSVDIALGERNELLRQRDIALGERNELLRQRDVALGERNELLRQSDIALGERNEFLRQRDVAIVERDRLLAERVTDVRPDLERSSQNSIFIATLPKSGTEFVCALAPSMRNFGSLIQHLPVDYFDWSHNAQLAFQIRTLPSGCGELD